MQRELVRRDRGFTLVEIMVVVLIIGMLSTIVSVAVIDHMREARVGIATADAVSIHEAANLWLLRNGDLPTVTDLVTPDANGKVWLERLSTEPRDPWDGEYEIRRLADRDGFEVVSAGADRTFDTDDDVSTQRDERR